jgi:alpha-L-fucosidase
VAVQQDHEHLFNSSACATDNGFVMAYESDDAKYVPFTIKFARSGNLRDWTKVPDAVFGADRYAACPCIRYVGGRFYLMYLEQRTPRWFFETWMARSRDLKTWEMSPANPVLTPGPGEDVNTSDPDIVEFGGKTYLYYCISDQRTWAKIKRAVYPGTLEAFFQAAFP